MEEEDLEFAAQALPANLKLLEVMLQSDPENRQILTLLSEGYSSYALGFIEDKDPDRARAFYRRGTEYGLRAVRTNTEIADALGGPVDSLRAVLMEVGGEYIPELFWTAFGRGGYTNLSLSDPDALAQLPETEAIMEYIAMTDSSFYYGGADLFLGALYGGRPKVLGGDTEKAKVHFERALQINRGTFLLTYVYYARTVAVQTLNEALFDELVHVVESTPLDAAPSIRLPNAIAKQKAHDLIARKSELF
jgi:hypothetical protein